jgi:hypothetical protein
MIVTPFALDSPPLVLSDLVEEMEVLKRERKEAIDAGMKVTIAERNLRQDFEKAANAWDRERSALGKALDRERAIVDRLIDVLGRDGC